MRSIYIFILFCCVKVSYSQDRVLYDQLISEAWKLYESQSYQASANKYMEAFVAFDNKGFINDRYNAACSWALAGNVDSAFVQLLKIAQGGHYTNLSHIRTDTDLNSLHDDPRWKEVIEAVTLNKEKSEIGLDKELVAILDTVFEEGQKYRKRIDAIAKEFGQESNEMQDLWKIMAETDSVNEIKVSKILDEHGWLGADVVGARGNQTLFLVIQHANIETQEKYLPKIREAVKNGKAQASHLAMLEDRVSLKNGGKQIYGSQIGMDQETGAYHLLPMIDPDNVDERREEVGLGKIQDYLNNWGLIWDAEAFKLKMDEFDASGIQKIEKRR